MLPPAFHRPIDSVWRKIESGHRPFIAHPAKRVMINAGFAATALFYLGVRYA
jgi:hypothetical protein